METKHTQGEWYVSDIHQADGKYIYTKDNPFSAIARVYKGENPHSQNAEANAKLIANAPDMLSVLREAVDHAHVYDTNPALVELFEAVIQKATN
jgi:hypothetical protein